MAPIVALTIIVSVVTLVDDAVTGTQVIDEDLR
jgi:hypothetical protein